MKSDKPPLLYSIRIPLLVAAALYRFIDLGFGEMQQWDESLYALRTMAATRFGEFLDQSAHVFGFYFCAHPPLYVWLAGLTSIFFGEHLWVYRFPSAAAGAVSVYLLYRIGKMVTAEFPAMLAALFFAFHPLILYYSRQGQLDLLLTMFMLAYVLLFLNYQRHGGAFLLLLGVLALAGALLTKFLFALGLPAAIFFWSFFPDPPGGEAPATGGGDIPVSAASRASKFGGWTAILGLLIAAPWFVAMTMKHGSGNPFFLISGHTPFGATMAGQEGSAASSGILFYPNQLVIQLSFLFPLLLAALWRLIRLPERSPRSLSALIVALYVIAISIPASKFIVYLIPVMGFAILLSFDALARLRRARTRELLYLFLAMIPCVFWSISLAGRLKAKALLGSLAGGKLPAGSDLAFAAALPAAAALLALLLLLLARRRRLQSLLAPDILSFVVVGAGIFALLGMVLREPALSVTGARDAAAALKADTTLPVIFVGNGINPALTYYLDGVDIGWTGTRRTFRRLEPSVEGAAGVRDKIDLYAKREGELMAVVEKDEIAQGVYSSSADVLPAGFLLLADTPRYMVVKIPQGSAGGR